MTPFAARNTAFEEAARMLTAHISRQALKRLPVYLQYLERVRNEGGETVTATAIAEALRLNEIQVRKDIAAVSSRPGRPMIGFGVDALIRDINEFFYYENVNDAVLIGAGALGTALMNYAGFSQCGMNLVAAFDADPARVGERVGGREVYPMSELERICRRLNIMIGILAVPAEAAQEACDRLVACGILAIWNFAPTFLRVPDGILVQNELMTSSLGEITRRLGAEEAEDGK